MPLLRPGTNRPQQVTNAPVSYQPKMWDIDTNRAIRRSGYQAWPEDTNLRDKAQYLTDPNYGPATSGVVSDTLWAIANRGDQAAMKKYQDYLLKNQYAPPAPSGRPYGDEFYEGRVHLDNKKQAGGPLDTEVISKRVGDQNLTRIINKYRNQPNDTTYTSMKPGNIFYHNTGQNLPGGKPLTNMSLNRQPVDINTVQPKTIQDSIAKIKSGLGLLKKGGKIYIKPENRGKFTATKKKTGKSTEELTHSKNPKTKKRAIFAQNARKWAKKKQDGGAIQRQSFDTK